MRETIFVDELECPYCDYDRYNESDIEIQPDMYCRTKVLCDGCGKEFTVTSHLVITVSKIEGVL